MFTRKHISPEGPVDMALRELQASDMASLVPTRTVDCRKTHLQAVLSFATIFFGTKNGYSEVTKQGFVSHGATLKQLNQALSQPNCYLYDEVVVSVTTLAMQEMLVPSGPQSYLHHMLGLERILALRDPSSPCSQRTVGLYRCLRHLMLFAALCAGKSSILAKPEWKVLLRQYCESEAELREQDLYDALADCSVLVSELSELLKNWQASDENHKYQIDSTRRRAQALCSQLQAWRAQNLANTYIETPPQWTSLQILGIRSLDKSPPVPTDHMFSNISGVLTLMLYNTAFLYDLHILITLPPEPQPQKSTQDYVDMAHLAVLEICRCMPDPSDKKLHADMHASPVVHWAVQVSYMILQNDLSTEGRWLLDLLNRKNAATITRHRTSFFKPGVAAQKG